VIILEQNATNYSPPAGFGDLDGRDVDDASAEKDALATRGRKPLTDEIDQLPQREAGGPHDCLGAAIAGRGKQFERAMPGWRISRALRGGRLCEPSRHRIAGDNRYGF